MAVDRQGLYHEFHVAVMGAEEELTKDTVIAIAAANGIDVEQFCAGMEDRAIQAYPEETMQPAQELGTTGTPASCSGIP